MRWRLFRAGLVAVAIALAGCGDKTFVDPTGTLEVEAGETFALQFHTNAGVGIDWDLDAKPPAGSPVSYKDTSFKDVEDSEGGSAQKLFTFKAEKAGTAELDFTEDYRGDSRRRRHIVVEVGE